MMRRLVIWVKRPILWMLAAYVSGLILALYVHVKPIYLLLLMICLLVGVFLLRKKILFPMILGLFLIFGSFRGSLFYYRGNSIEPLINENVKIQGYVQGMPEREQTKITYIIKLIKVLYKDKAYDTTEKIKVTLYYPIVEEEPGTSYSLDSTNNSDMYTNDDITSIGSVNINAGDLVEISGVLKEPSSARNPHCFDYKLYLARKNIYNVMYINDKDIELIKEGNPLKWSNILPYLRGKAMDAIDVSVGGGEGKLLKAMLLGARWEMDPVVEDGFSKVGLTHILSISGLHVGYIVIMLNKISDLLKQRRWTSFIARSSILILYSLLVGGSSPIVRAVIMSIIYLLGQSIGRRTDPINTAAVAAFAILLVKPMSLFDVGFQLSFTAVIGIALLYALINDKLYLLPKKIKSSFSLTLSAQTSTLPLTTYYFNAISPISFISNLVIVPIVGIAVIGGFILIPLALIFPAPARILGLPISWICSFILKFTSFTSNLKYGRFRVVSPSVFAICVFYLLIWVISRERPSFIKKPFKAVLVIIMIFISLTWAVGVSKPDILEAIFVDVGQGDCTLIKTPDGKNILIDGGGSESKDVGQEVVVPFLLKNGISSLDLVIMSHDHLDHIGGLIPVVEELNVKAFMEYPPLEVNDTYIRLKSIINEKNIPLITASAGETYNIEDGLVLSVIYPDENISKVLGNETENNLSLVLLLQLYNVKDGHYDALGQLKESTSILFTGDIEASAESYIVNQISGKVDILKVPHHGSKTSSTEAFIGAVSPYMGIIQVGTNNFGHPNEKVLKRFEDYHVRVFRNDEQGAIMLKYENDRWHVATMIE